MIRVLHVLCDLSSGGAERLVLQLCRHHAPDIHPTVATVQGLGPLEADFRAAGVHVLRGGRTRRHLGIRALGRLRRAMSDVDIVHTHLFAGDTWGRLAAILSPNRPAIITTEHNVNRNESWQVFVKRALAPHSTLVAVSAAVAEYSRSVERIGPMLVIPNGIDLTRFQPHRGADGRRILAIGRLVPQKGFDVLVEALPEDMTLDIVGEGPWRVHHPRVRFLGRRDDVPDLLAQADILAVPSRWEGFGLAAAEGLAAGIAVVASDVDGLREVIGDAGLLVPAEDPGQLRLALQRLRDAPELRSALGARGKERAHSKLDIRATIDRYESLYREKVREGSTSLGT